jgi:hypothetical protein
MDKDNEQFENFCNSSNFVTNIPDEPHNLTTLQSQSALPMYYTSIVDLKPFDQNELERLARQHKRILSPVNNTLPLITRNLSSANIQNNKRFLINKNIRFYQPIRDAEMLTQLDRLRHKLASAKPEIQKISRLSVLSSMRNSIVSTNQVDIDQSNTLADIETVDLECKEDQIETPENIDTLNNGSPRQSFNIDAPKQGVSCSFEASNSDSQIQEAHTINSSRLKIDKNVEQAVISIDIKEDVQIKEATNFSKSNSFACRSRTMPTTPKITQVCHEPCFKMSQMKVQHLVRQSTRNRLSNIYRADESNSNNNNLVINHKQYSSDTAVNSLENMSSTNVTSDTLNQNQNNSESRGSSPYNYYNMKTFSNTNNNRMRTATTLSFKSIPSNRYSNSICPPTSMSHKQVRFDSAVSKKLHPSVKYQQGKDDEPQCVENIINDVPSSIKIMSKKGKATNIEKLIAVKLSEYYTNHRLVY